MFALMAPPHVRVNGARRCSPLWSHCDPADLRSRVTASKRAGIEFEVLEYDASEAAEPWGTGAARALGIAPERVFETLVVHLGGASLAVAIVPVAARLDLKAVPAALGAKRAAMAEPAAANAAKSEESRIARASARATLPTDPGCLVRYSRQRHDARKERGDAR